jgi:putative phage-type endonuclease
VTVLDEPEVDWTALATPASICLYDGPPHTDEWFTVRRAGITASDIPCILGDSDHGNAVSVWAHKRGLIDPDDAGEPAHWGLILEDPIADEWARRNGTGVRRVGVLANATNPWQRASLDRLVTRCPDGDGPCGLEVKNKSAWLAGRWRDEVPDDVHGQVAWQMLVTGYRHMHVAALIGGNRLTEHRVDWDPLVETYVVAAAAAVWESVTDPDAEPPAATYNRLHRDVLDRLHPDREGVRTVTPARATALVTDYLRAAETLSAANTYAKAAKAAKEAAEAAIVEALEDGDTLAVAGADIALATYTTVTQPPKAGCSYRQVRVRKAGLTDLQDRLEGAA